MLVSVVLPIYNGLPHLREAISSILAQEIDLELIVSDDGSTDGSAAVVREICDSRVRLLLNESNAGIFGNLNRCISVSAAPFVQIFSQDDVMRPGFLAAQMKALEKHPDAGLVYGAADHIDENGQPMTGPPPDSTPELIDEKLYLWIASHFGALPASISSVMVRRRTFDVVGMFNSTMRVAGDVEFYNRVSEHFPIVRCPEPLHSVRSHGLMTTVHSTSGLRYLEEELSLDSWFEARWGKDDYKLVRRFRSGLRGTQHLVWIAKRALAGDVAGALSAFVKLNRLYPVSEIASWHLRRLLIGRRPMPGVRAPPRAASDAAQASRS